MNGSKVESGLGVVPTAAGGVADVDRVSDRTIPSDRAPGAADSRRERKIYVVRPTGFGRLAELWRFRELAFFLVWREVKIRYKQTILGAAWAVIQPLFAMIVFTVLFGRLARLPSEGIPYPVFYYAGLLPWTYFAAVLSGAGNSLIQNSQLVTKVYFPRVLLPAASAGAALLDFGIAALFLPLLMLLYGVPLGPGLLLIPVLTVPLALVALGVGLLLSALNVNYRDVKYVIPFLTQLWMFLTPVVYPVTLIPERLRPVAALNPLTGIVDAFRAAAVGQPISWQTLGPSLLVIAVVLAVGVTYFNRTERYFADVI
jgi:lipopolysaccharide transport system permease protein